MTTLTEDFHAGAFLVSEAPGSRSRELITVKSGDNLKAGHVIGAVPTFTSASAAGGANTGNGTIGSITINRKARIGDYVFKCTGTGPGTVATVAAPLVVGTGNGTISTITVGAGAKVGSYVAQCVKVVTDKGDFEVIDPNGNVIGIATTGVAFSKQGIAFTISDGSGDFALGDSFTFAVAAKDSGVFSVETPDGRLLSASATVGTAFATDEITATISDGSTDFVANDKFTVSVLKAANKYREWNPANSDGSEVAVGVLWSAVDATAGDAAGVAILRDAEVASAALTYFSGASANQQSEGNAMLAANQVIVR